MSIGSLIAPNAHFSYVFLSIYLPAERRLTFALPVKRDPFMGFCPFFRSLDRHNAAERVTLALESTSTSQQELVAGINELRQHTGAIEKLLREVESLVHANRFRVWMY